MNLIVLSKDIEAEIRKECFKIGLDAMLLRDLVTRSGGPGNMVITTFLLTDPIVINFLPELEKIENSPVWLGYSGRTKLQRLVCDCKIIENNKAWSANKVVTILSKWLNGFSLLYTSPKPDKINRIGIEFTFTSENRLRLAMPLPNPEFDVDIEEIKPAIAKYGDIEL